MRSAYDFAPFRRSTVGFARRSTPSGSMGASCFRRSIRSPVAIASVFLRGSSFRSLKRHLLQEGASSLMAFHPLDFCFEFPVACDAKPDFLPTTNGSVVRRRKPPLERSVTSTGSSPPSEWTKIAASDVWTRGGRCTLFLSHKHSTPSERRLIKIYFHC